MSTTQKPLRNNAIAKLIASALVGVHPFQHTAKIEDILNRHVPARRSTPAPLSHGMAHTNDEATSIAAAQQVNVTKQQKVILQTLCVATVALHAGDLSKFTGLKLNSASTRMCALVDHKLVAKISTRQSEGRAKTTYAITAAGREWLTAQRVAA